jgi:hypothetical protein
MLPVVPAFGGAVFPQYVELVRDLRRAVAEQVAGIGVAGHEPQGLLLAAADHDRRVRSADRRRHVQRLGQLVVPAVEPSVVVAPHLQADLQRFLEPFETLAPACSAIRAVSARAPAISDGSAGVEKFQ